MFYQCYMYNFCYLYGMPTKHSFVSDYCDFMNFISLYLHNNLFTKDGCFFHYNDNQKKKNKIKK